MSMHIAQLVLNNAEPLRRKCFLTHPLLIPAYVAILLLVTQAFIGIARSRLISKLFGYRESPSNRVLTPEARANGFLNGTKQLIKSQGVASLVYKFLSLLGTLTLAVLTSTALYRLEHTVQTKPDASGRETNKNGLEQIKSIEIIYLALYSYASLLALISLSCSFRWSFAAKTHLNIIMLAIVAVYTYRDLVPLATYTLKPADMAQGWLLWSRIGVACFVGIFIPLVTPRIYIPVDPLNPAKEVNIEQIAPWWSYLTYTYLDSLILLAARTPHLPYESLPPLADYDRSEHLVAKSEQILDPYLRGKRTHLFWGLIRFFASEYVRLFFMMVIKVFSNFIPPYALKQLLNYLQRGGKGATLRPWVWISLLFIGPNIGSIAIQYYIFLATRMIVRTEAIITQLVFDHALRIRMKQESKPGSTSTSAINTPDTRSLMEADTEVGSNSEEDTRRESASASSSAAKGKKKAVDPSSTIPAQSDPKPESETENSNLVGRINNYVATDLGNVIDGRDFLFIVVLGPLQFAISVWFLYDLLGWSALVGMGVMIVSIPLPGYVAKRLNTVQTERMKKTDARVQTVTEILSVIRMTKLFGWENKVNEQITQKREEELRLLKKRQLLNLVNSNLNYFLPLITMLVTFASYTLIQKKELSAATVFSGMAVFDQLRDCIHGTFYMLPMMINAKVSLGRINEFLLNSELLDRFTKNTDAAITIDPEEHIGANDIGFRDASFSWDGADNQTEGLRRYSLRIDGELFFKRGCLNLVIGPTGSGKTSLLMALLGEMHYEPIGERAGFRLPREGGVAYAAQEAWVQSETIKENILFGKPYDEERYNKVIYQCGLERDLSLFEGGDATEVGEKGLTLSGGQKARVTLARAVYSNATILLLDDILAALDVHTSKFIVDKCLRGDLLEGRTTIIVTHNVAMVGPIAQFVVSIGLDGRIASQGTVSDALEKDIKLLEEVTESNEKIEKAEEIVDPALGEKKDIAAAKLVVPEEIALGHVDWSALKLYLSSLGGATFWIVFIGGMALSDLCQSLSVWFLGHWASQYNDHPAWAVPVAYYLSMYALIIAGIGIFWSIGATTFVFGSIKASREVHKKLIASVLGTTLRWLDTVPTARVIARCTQDIRAVDGPIKESLGDTVELTMILLAKFAAVVLFVPFFALPGIVVFIVGTICGQLYIKAQLSVKREMSNRRSPVLAHFGAAIAGLISIRAYGAQHAFKKESLKRIDAYSRPARTFYNCNRWVCIRIDAIGSAFSASLAAYLVYVKSLNTASNTGFSLTMAISFSGMILWWIRILNELEVQGNSLERIDAYVNIDQEPKATESGKPPAYWPASGTLTVENLCARYSVDGPEVLHNLSFEIKSGERVGVVGRTGSGKSSLTLSLLRCIPTEGQVIFDGIPANSINLDALRSSITIIPQQPELLSGTLRENLDPFSEHSDATLNEALRAAGLFNLQEENDASRITLDSGVSSGGGNLSVGQRQILALARAIVRRSKLLILDEATSAIDYATDSIIQNTLREVLKDATLITVAHRLQTIMDADKIMVLDAGNMVEFDTPANLLKKTGGYLKSLVDDSGDRETLYKMAEKKGESSQ